MEARLVDSEGLGSQVAAAARRDSGLMHTVNSNLRQCSEVADTSESIAFFCECQTAKLLRPGVALGGDSTLLSLMTRAGYCSRVTSHLRSGIAASLCQPAEPPAPTR